MADASGGTKVKAYFSQSCPHSNLARQQIVNRRAGDCSKQVRASNLGSARGGKQSRHQAELRASTLHHAPAALTQQGTLISYGRANLSSCPPTHLRVRHPPFPKRPHLVHCSIRKAQLQPASVDAYFCIHAAALASVGVEGFKRGRSNQSPRGVYACTGPGPDQGAKRLFGQDCMAVRGASRKRVAWRERVASRFPSSEGLGVG